MAGIPTQLFLFATPARPDRVWEALTDPATTAAWLFGLRAQSSWEPGSALSLAAAGAPPLDGEVLAATRPARLSYAVRAGAGQPSTYVTWELEGDGGGTVVRLYVDEPGDFRRGGDGAEAAAAWAAVVERLRSVLADAAVPRRRPPQD